MKNPNDLFSSPDGKEIYVADVNSFAARVGPEPRTLPVELHLKALQEGCVRTPAGEPSAKASSQQAPKDLAPAIERAIKEMLVRQTAGDFTQGGMPNLTVVSSIIGEPAPRDLTYGVFERLKAEAKAE